MNIFNSTDDCKVDDVVDPREGNQRATVLQLVLSIALGLSSFITFCILRPRWKTLYAARKRQRDAASMLPELPDTFFGWIPVLYKITEEQVLASAGLDAYVFLSFFKMSIKLVSVMLLLAAVIMVPINSHFVGLPGFGRNDTINGTGIYDVNYTNYLIAKKGHKGEKRQEDLSYLWSYLVFTYVFTGLAVYFILAETRKIIRVRQDYLGSQSTITDRTIKLSGIPEELRSERRIAEVFEKLEIGKVESVTICRNWKGIDDLMKKRHHLLRKLEEFWTIHLKNENVEGAVESLENSEPESPSSQDDGEESHQREDENLIGQSSDQTTVYDGPRPTTRIWYGFLRLQSQKIDAIDYYEEHLRRVDGMIKDARKANNMPTALAFVTMDSISACQMAVQALLDPQPTQLLASLAPAPSDIVWTNTYLPRLNRMIWSWSISIFVVFLSIIWLIPIATAASLLNLCTITKFWHELGSFLSQHQNGRALVQTILPTLVASLLNVAVPFLYDYLSNMQGMISQSEVELSVISKNFFFTFFNIFFVITAFGTATNIWGTLKQAISDTTIVAYALATSLNSLGLFYSNFILLQGLGLFPLRLLQFGSVSWYPILKMSARTPRDYAELKQPPVFKYGFYLPTAILVLILCIVYSVLPAGYQVLFFGLIYFVIGYFIYKYQLLYAMDHPQHATGRAWTMICYRIMVGLGIFQLAMAGVIALKKAFTAAGLVLPLIGITIWFSYFFRRTFEPLTKYIALRSIRRGDDPHVNIADENIGIDSPPGNERRGSTTIDEDRERGQKYVNPSLVVQLEKIWINQRVTNDNGSPIIRHEESTASSLSLGDTHIWRENGDNNV